MPDPVNGVAVCQVTEYISVSSIKESAVNGEISGYGPPVVCRKDRQPGIFQALAAESFALPPETTWEPRP